MFIRHYSTFLCLLVFPCCLRAQLSETDTTAWQYLISASGSITRGNAERVLLLNKAEIKHVQQPWGFITSNTYRYGTLSRVKREDDIGTKNYLYWHPHHRLYPYGLLWVESNLRQKLGVRWMLGGGVTKVAVQQPDLLIKLTAGFVWEKNRYLKDVPELESRGNGYEPSRWRARLFARFAAWEGAVKGNVEAWYMPAWNFNSDYRYYIDGNIDVPVKAGWSFRAHGQFLYNNWIVPGTSRGDLLITYGLLWSR